VRSVEGACAPGHSVGDKVVFGGETVQGRVCLHALYRVPSKVFAMRYGAGLPWLDSKHQDVGTQACPDPQNPVVFKVRRAPEERG
jgi:uncharacterized repeat protein (TIGR04076 family)